MPRAQLSVLLARCSDRHSVCAACAQWQYLVYLHDVCLPMCLSQPLYSAAAKFDSGCGWPAFDKIVEGAVVTQTDSSMGMKRVEILCSGCGGHLGVCRSTA